MHNSQEYFVTTVYAKLGGGGGGGGGGVANRLTFESRARAGQAGRRLVKRLAASPLDFTLESVWTTTLAEKNFGGGTRAPFPNSDW